VDQTLFIVADLVAVALLVFACFLAAGSNGMAMAPSADAAQASALVNRQTYTVSAGGTTLGSAVAGEQVSGMGGGQGGPGGGQPPRG
jgi:hypothetical protein